MEQETLIKEILDYCGSLDSYSGRGMYGSKCYSLKVDSESEGISEIIQGARYAARNQFPY